MKKKLLKISIGVFSLVIFLGLLEIGLRFAGHFYLAQRSPDDLVGISSIIGEKDKDKMSSQPEKDYTILAVGDSYTYGEIYSIEKTYPRLLEKRISGNNLDKRYNVINAGICEYNSRQVLIRLPGWIEKYNPNMVILLAGAADQFNLAGYSFSEMGRRSLFADLRIYKIAKITFLNIKARILGLSHRWRGLSRGLLGQQYDLGIDGFALATREHKAWLYIREMAKIKEFNEEYSPVERAWYHYNNGNRQKAIEVSKQALESNPSSVKILSNLAFFHYLTDFYDSSDDDEFPTGENIIKAFYYYRKAYQIDPNSEFVLNGLAYLYTILIDSYLQSRQPEMVVRFLKKAIKLDPLDHHLYYLLAASYEMQSKYLADHVLNAFQEMLKENPELRTSELFMKYLTYFENKKEWEARVDKHVEKNLEEIAKLCQDHNIKLVVQNYPRPYAAANQILEKIALKHSLPFVDNLSLFEELAQEDEYWQDYISFHYPDSPTTFRIMADNVYRVLTKEGLFENN